MKKISGAPKELDERDPATRARQIDGPHVVQRNAREKCVDAQGKPFELFASDLRHCVALALNFSVPTSTATTGFATRS
jgi:hypothetical protein